MTAPETVLVGSLFLITAGMTATAVYAYFGGYWREWFDREDDDE